MVRKRSDRVWIRPRVVYPSREEAERQRRIVEAALKAGTLDAPATWAEAVDAFLADRASPSGDRRRQGVRPSTIAAYRSHLGVVGRVLADPDPLTLSLGDARRYVEARTAEGSRPATIRAGLEAATIMQRWLVERGWIPKATWSDIARPEVLTSRRALRPDEVGQFLRAAMRLGRDPTLGDPASERRLPDWERWPAAAWLLMHGLRTSEAAHLLVRDIDLVTGHVHVEDRDGARTKTRSSARVIPILAELALEILRETFRGKPADELAFPVHTRTPTHGGAHVHDRTAWFLRRTHITCEVAGIERVSAHELRHSVATAAIVAGADMHSVQSLLGHSDARMTARVYAHASAADRAMGAARVVSDYLTRVVEARPAIRVAK